MPTRDSKRERPRLIIFDWAVQLAFWEAERGIARQQVHDNLKVTARGPTSAGCNVPRNGRAVSPRPISSAIQPRRPRPIIVDAPLQFQENRAYLVRLEVRP